MVYFVYRQLQIRRTCFFYLGSVNCQRNSNAPWGVLVLKVTGKLLKKTRCSCSFYFLIAHYYLSIIVFYGFQHFDHSYCLLVWFNSEEGHNEWNPNIHLSVLKFLHWHAFGSWLVLFSPVCQTIIIIIIPAGLELMSPWLQQV